MTRDAAVKRQNYHLLQQIGRNITYYRKQLGLTQELLAEKIGISRAHLARVETGMGAASLPLLCAISVALDIPLKALFDFEAGTAGMYGAEG